MVKRFKFNRFFFISTDKSGASLKGLTTVYEARRVNEELFIVGWSEYGETKTMEYSAESVAEHLSYGFWEMLTEDEAMKFIKGLY